MIMKETVLYYSPAPAAYVAKLKGVLVRMGIRIKNIDPKQINQKVGYLAGMPGFTETVKDASQGEEKEKGQQESEKLSEREEPALLIPEEMLVMKNFTNRRLDELLTNFRKAGVPKIALKAVITEQNSQWTFYQLYGELNSEHAAMSGQATN